MKNKKSYLGWLIILAITLTAIILVRHFHIKNFCIIEDGTLYTSGQPRGMDYTRLLYKYHIATIVNVRTNSEHRDKNWHNEEITFVKSNGVKYIEIPIDKNNPCPDTKTSNEFLEIMADKLNLPVLLHGSGDDERVAILTAVWLIKSQNKTCKEAIQTAEKIKKESLTKAEMKFVEGLNK
ncbi:MAG: dual specificity protein phosphatase family protein [Planctomycetes bacterium]|nr:dual specificity protein phosphatase family protein [Planctomycetota bacterium]